MSRRPIFRLLALALLLPASTAFADTASTSATVRIERYALQLTKVRDIDFGSATPSVLQNGYITLSPTGLHQVNGGIAAYDPTGAQPAQYTVSGVPSAPFAVMFSASTIYLSNGTQTLMISDFVIENGPTQVLGLDGTAQFRVGANLYVGAAQMPGTYTGTFSVTVAYN